MRPELLAPAGSPEALRAAVQNGADAVYLGWGAFNARRGAKNFSDEEFAAALAYCHERGVRVFLTLNTLVTDRELPQALETAVQAGRLGVDAVLVQDWGLFGLLRRTLPDLPLHASTQMSLFTSGGAREIAADGCERVVIARECSAEDTRTICENCPVEVEVFAHGALCMCYSGQCGMSALIGGRSGNRGRCAQPCRLPYGVNAPAKKAYPLSLKDSCLAGRLEEMGAMGVSCVKLEGRMKRPEYVAVITRIYARLLEEGRGPTADERAELEQAFSIDGISKSPAVFDYDKLNWFNAEYIKAMGEEEFTAHAMPYYREVFGAQDKPWEVLYSILPARITKFQEIPGLLHFLKELPDYPVDFFVNKKSKANLENSPQMLQAAIPVLEALPDWNVTAIHDSLIALAGELGVKNGTLLWPVRIAAAGTQVTPGGAMEILALLGREEALRRLRAGLAKLQA